MEHQHVVDDGVVFLLEYVLGEIKDSARSLLLDYVGARLGLSRLIFDIDVWWHVFVSILTTFPPLFLGGLVFIPIDVPLSK